MIELDDQQKAAQAWFRSLRDSIWAMLEQLEDESTLPGDAGRFEKRVWNRTDHAGGGGGGGEMGIMKGRLFEKAGVNISTVYGEFNPDFAKQINGAAEDPRFFATGLSLVIHPANPLVPAVHMNTRMLVTTKRWFGGGVDLNPALPDAAETAAFHAAVKATCDRHSPDYYPAPSKWAEEYFWVPHRNRHRGVGGIFYDHLNSGDWAADFAYTQDVGRCFLETYPKLVRAKMHQDFSEAQRIEQLKYRGLYAEFNLVYDRGTTFGLKTGGNTDAILMSLPPLAIWE